MMLSAVGYFDYFSRTMVDARQDRTLVLCLYHLASHWHHWSERQLASVEVVKRRYQGARTHGILHVSASHCQMDVCCCCYQDSLLYGCSGYLVLDGRTCRSRTVLMIEVEVLPPHLVVCRCKEHFLESLCMNHHGHMTMKGGGSPYCLEEDHPTAA